MSSARSVFTYPPCPECGYSLPVQGCKRGRDYECLRCNVRFDA